MNYELLRIFKMVAYYGSISKAAEKLFVTQPSVTKSIKKLEESMGIVLFVREKKGMVLTDDGKRLYRNIFDAINTLDDALDIAKGMNELNSGTLKIGAGNSVTKNFLAKTIIDFKKLYPNISIEIKNSSSETLYNDLRYGKLDLIFINSTVIISNKYNSFKLANIDDCFFCNCEYYKKIKNVISINNILSEKLIVQSNSYDTRSFLNSICLKNNIALKPYLEVEHHSLLVLFVENGLGIGFATKQYIKEELDNKELIEIKVKFPIAKRYINGVLRNNKDVKVKKFIELLKYNTDKK